MVNRGPEAAIEVVRRRSGRWFDPELVRGADLGQRRVAVDGLDQETSIYQALDPGTGRAPHAGNEI